MDLENGLRELKQDASYDMNNERQSEDEDEAERKHLVFKSMFAISIAII